MRELGERVFYALPEKIFLGFVLFAGLLKIIGYLIKSWCLDIRDNM